MSSPLIYLTGVKIKNQLKSLIKTPSKLIYALFMVALLVFVIFSGSLGEEANMEIRGREELVAIIMAFYTFVVAMTFIQAYNQGSSMFTLSDVNHLFAAPIKPQKVLMYGLFRQLGLSLLLGFFLLFQYSWMHNIYAVDIPQIIIFMVLYGLSLFMSQMLAMTLFIYTSGNETAQRIVRLVTYALLILLAAGAALKLLPLLQAETRDFDTVITNVVSYMNSWLVFLFPVTGWVAGILYGIYFASAIHVIVFSLIIVAFISVTIAMIAKSKRNFYEDLIAAAETSYSAISAQKEGKVGEVVSKKVKVGKVGLDGGSGSSAIFYKHKVENRRSGMFFVGNMALIFAAITIFMSLFFKELGDGALIAVFSMGTYMQIFSVSLGGRFTRELTRPYIYLIPEPPLKKLFAGIAESLISSFFEALLIFVPVMLILGSNPLEIVFCVIARVSFALLFLSANIVLQKVFGSVSARYLVILFYILIILIMVAPAIVLAAIAFTLGSGMIIPLVVMTIANLLISMLVMFMCQSVLQYSDFNH